MRLSDILNKSVATRTTILVLVVTTIILVVSGFYQGEYVRSIIATEMDHQAGRAMGSAVKVIDRRVACVETALETAAAYADMLAPYESKADTLLMRLINSNEDIAAVTLLYRADYFPKRGRYYAPTISRKSKTGELVKDEIGGPNHDFCYLETDSNWVYTNQLDHGYWCLPYVDSMSTKRAMVTYSVPLHDKNNDIYAVLCADVDLHWVNGIAEEAKPYEYSDVIVMSRDSQYVCHPNPAWVLSRNVVEFAHQLQDRNFLNLTDQMLKHQRGKDTLELLKFSEGSHQNNKKAENYIVFFAPIERVQWSVCFLIPEKSIMANADTLRNWHILATGLLLIVISLMIYIIIHSQLRPLEGLAEDAYQVAKGRFDAPLPDIDTHDEIRHLRDSFADMQTSLKHYIEELQTTTASKAAMDNELKIASDIQRSMLPKVFPPYPERHDIEIYGSLTPAKGVGGDLFDFFIRDEKLFFCIGDVSGKGVPASLVMAVTRSQFRILSEHASKPSTILKTINHNMADHNDNNMFVTLFVGVLDLKTGVLQYANAGHDNPIILTNHAEDDNLLPVDANLPVGVMPGWDFTLQKMTLQPDTTIFLYTDGLTEAENIDHEQFGMKRIQDTITQTERHFQPEQLVKNMTEAVRHFVGGAEQSDDLTMLCVQYMPKDTSAEKKK